MALPQEPDPYRPPAASLAIDEGLDPSVARVVGDALGTFSAPLAFLLVLTTLPSQLAMEWMAMGIEDATAGSAAVALLMIALLGFVVSPLQACLVLAAAECRSRHESPGGVELLRRALSAWGRVLVSLIVPSLAIGFGALFFILPGIYLMVRYAFIAVLAFEGGAESALYREQSTELARGRFWPILGLIAIFYLPVLIVPSLLGALSAFVPVLAHNAVLVPAGVAGTVFASLLTVAIWSLRRNYQLAVR